MIACRAPQTQSEHSTVVKDKKNRVDPIQLERHAYQVSHLIASFTVPMMRRLYQEFDGDLVQIIVLGEISLRNVDQFFRKAGDDAPEKLLDDAARRTQLMQTCNALSISEATGIPRETVRRKVEQLIDKGWLYRDERKRLIVRQGVGERMLRGNARTAQEILELADRLQRLLAPAQAPQD